MALNVTPDGFLLDLWRINTKGERVFPHIQGKKNSTERGFAITLTESKADYHLVDLEGLLYHLSKGNLQTRGRIRMKALKGNSSNGFSLQGAGMSEALEQEIRRRKVS